MAGQWAWNSPASVKLDLPIRATRRDCPLFSLVFYTVLLCSRESTRNQREIDGKLYLSTYLRVTLYLGSFQRFIRLVQNAIFVRNYSKISSQSSTTNQFISYTSTPTNEMLSDSYKTMFDRSYEP